jgi:hypothetical protein
VFIAGKGFTIEIEFAIQTQIQVNESLNGVVSYRDAFVVSPLGLLCACSARQKAGHNYRSNKGSP